MQSTHTRAAALAAAFALAPASAAFAQVTAPATPVGEVIVTASRLDRLGQAMSASQGAVTRQEVELRPIYRISQVYESVPGLVVTVHSGESKAPQYELRGFDLDHGTDFASFVDAMPVNQGTNLHGQGYSDQSYLMAQTVAGLDYTKGPYHAGLGGAPSCRS
jgi:outer membrane receptor protein involved in Fe transport